MITYNEKTVIVRVRDDAARHRYKHVFSTVRSGVIVCVRIHCTAPPESSQSLALKYLLHLNLELIWLFHDVIYSPFPKFSVAMSEVDRRYGVIRRLFRRGIYLMLIVARIDTN